MKILYVHNDYARPSGEEHAAASLADLLKEKGHEVEFFRRSSAEVEGKAAGKVKAFFTGISNPLAARALARRLDEYRPDLVQVQNLYPLLSPDVFRPIRKRGIPIVMRCPNYRLFCPNGLCFDRTQQVCEACFGGREWNCFLKNCEGSRFKSLGYALRGWAARVSGRILDNVDMFIVQTEFQKRKFMAQGISAERIGIVPGIMPKIRSEGWTPGTRITFVGRVSPEKGIEDFLECARRLPQLEFAVAGSHEGMPGIVEKAPGNVRWLGFLSGDALRQAYLDSRIILIPSKWYEGFPNVIVMGMMLAKPIVTADIGATGSIIADGRTGRLYPPGDATALTQVVSELHGDLGLCEQFGTAGRQEAEALYARDRIYETLASIYEKARINAARR